MEHVCLFIYIHTISKIICLKINLYNLDVCMVFEVLGNNLLKLITRSNYTGIPLENVRIIVKQVLEAMHYLHTKCKIIHTDLKPENVLLCVNEEHVKQLAEEANNWAKMGIKPSVSAGIYFNQSELMIQNLFYSNS